MSKKSLWPKIWKSLAALAIVFGLLAPLGLKLDVNLWVLIVISVMFFVVYWHFLEKAGEKIKAVKTYFIDLKKDIDYIKDQVDLNKRKNKKAQLGSLISSIRQIIVAAILLYILILIIRALYL